MQRSLLVLLSIVFCLIPLYSTADASKIEFGLRDGSRCGDADRAAEGTLKDVLGYPHVLERLADASISVPETIGYLPADTAECEHFRRNALQARAAYAIRRALHGGSGWPEFWVYEYFRLRGGIAQVALQSSTLFLENLDYDNPLTIAWPGRYVVVYVLDADGNLVGAWDSLGRIYLMDN